MSDTYIAENTSLNRTVFYRGGNASIAPGTRVELTAAEMTELFEQALDFLYIESFWKITCNFYHARISFGGGPYTFGFFSLGTFCFNSESYSGNNFSKGGGFCALLSLWADFAIAFTIFKLLL